MVQPVGAVIELFRFSGFDVDRVERHRQSGREAALHHLALARITVAGRRLAGGCVRIRSGDRLRYRAAKFPRHVNRDHASAEKRFIGIERKTGAGAQFCVLNDLARRF